MTKKNNKIEFGDFQTPAYLAEKCTHLISKFYSPDLIIEPTCGLGSFLISSKKIFGKEVRIQGYEINKEYIDVFYKKNSHLKSKIIIKHSDFFCIDWEKTIPKNQKVLIIGNLPWVTSSKIGSLVGKNLPPKTNLKKLTGIESKTGKSNFDISEWMLIKLSQALSTRNGVLAMLSKTSVARKVFLHNSQNNLPNASYKAYKIDTKKHFKASVDACLFVADFSRIKNHDEYKVYGDLAVNTFQQKIGITECGTLVSDMDKYTQTEKLVKGKSFLTWRSGLKHDCSKIMELKKTKNGHYTNGLNEIVDIEDNFVFPLLKGSDLANNRIKEINKFVIVTQKKIGEETERIKNESPKLWRYLVKHKDTLAARKSSIYKKQPPFAIFGVGEYSFKPYKIAIPSFYKQINFRLLSPYQKKTIMLDDTCYLLGFDDLKKAQEHYKLLQGEPVQTFIESLIFSDSKRPLNINILKSLDLKKVARLEEAPR